MSVSTDTSKGGFGLAQRYIQRASSCLFTGGKQTDLENPASTEVGYTDGVSNGATNLVTDTTYQKIVAVPFANEDVYVRAWFLNGLTSSVTVPGSALSWSSGVSFAQDFPTTDGSTVATPVLDYAGFTIPAAAGDANATFTSKTYTRTAARASVTITGHGIREGLMCYVTTATDTALIGNRVIHVEDANTISFDNPNGSTSGGTLTIQAQSAVQGVGYSNWVRVKILTPTDGNAKGYGYLYGRMLPQVSALNAMFFRTDLMASDTNVPALKERIVIKTSSSWLTQKTGTWNASPGSLCPFNVQILSAKKAVTVAIMGDSTSAGAGSTSGIMGWPQISCDSLSSLNRPVTCVSWAWAGQTPGFFFGRAMNMLDYADMRPDILIIQPGGQNKGGFGWAAASASWAWGQTLALMRKCQQYGVIPVLRTCTPSADLSAADDLVRIQYNAYVRTAATQGVPVIDFSELVTTAGTPQTLSATYAASNAHLNDAGHLYVAPVAKAVLANLVAEL